MPSKARLEWNGDELVAKVELAAAEAIDDVTAACVDDAKASHWWIARNGMEPGRKRLRGGLEGQIVNERASVEGSRITGGFGSTVRGFYGLFLEYRFPWLRPAADRNFHTLAGRIKEKLQ